jgi:hypothetical protein
VACNLSKISYLINFRSVDRGNGSSGSIIRKF